MVAEIPLKTSFAGNVVDLSILHNPLNALNVEHKCLLTGIFVEYVVLRLRRKLKLEKGRKIDFRVAFLHSYRKTLFLVGFLCYILDI